MKPAPINADLVAKAMGLYSTMVGLTTSPHEAQQILLIMHLHLWINCKSGEESANTMLEEYTLNFLDNLRVNGFVEDLKQ